MKIQLILLTEPILVERRLAKDGEICNAPYNNGLYTFSSKDEGDGIADVVIAGIPKLPSIDFSALSEEDCKKIGWVDVETLALNSAHANNHSTISEHQSHSKGFIEGFKVAQSLNEKKFSEGDMWNCFVEGKISKGATSTFDKFIQSLSQPKVIDVEVETKCGNSLPDEHLCTYKVPKITNNSIKVTKVL